MIEGEQVLGSHAYLEQPGLFGLPGLDQLNAFVEKRLPAPPVQRLSGLSVVEVDRGGCTWSMPASPWWQTATGLFPGGALAFAADGALAGAIYTTLPEGVGVLTAGISISFLRPASPRSGTILARGRVIHAGRQQGLAEARLEDLEGRLLAHATSRCLLRPLPFEPPAPPESFAPLEPLDSGATDPHRRPIEGDLVPPGLWNETSGLELMRRWRDGTLAAPPICRLTGWRLVEVDEGVAVCAMPASGWFSTAFGTFYGGAVALLADAALGAAVTTTLPPGTSFGTLDLKVDLLRPVMPDGRELAARAEVARRGRTVAVTSVGIEDAEGRTVAMATGSALILPDRPWGTEERDDAR